MERGLLSRIPEYLKKIAHDRIPQRYCIITDHTVKKLFGTNLQKSLKKASIDADLISIPAGENQKTLATVEKIIHQMLEKKFDRSSCILTLGGGVIGDIGGFTASIFMRGIPYIHIPTTLLAMVDSSIGGKTGVDTQKGKNLIGSIYQPKAVFIDPDLLKTLPEKEFKNGFVELIKHAIIQNKKLFQFIEKNVAKLKNSEILNKIMIQSLQIKVRIIEKDEKEKNLRMILNYGHTLGHAIEKANNYKLSHGEAVAIGATLINAFCVKKNWMPKKDAERINAIFQHIGIPTALPKKLSIKKIFEALQSDKKFMCDEKNFNELAKNRK
jgi:3-dehydroquinate synthase